MDKKTPSERDICTKFITPGLAVAGWAVQRQVREEVSFTQGRVIVCDRLHTPGQARRARFVPYDQAQPVEVLVAQAVAT